MQRPQDQRDPKRQCLLSPVPTIGDLEVRGHLRTRYGISSICGNAAWLFGQNGTSALNCHLTMSKRTLNAGHVHATDTMSTHSMAVSGTLTAGCISTSASLIAESILGNSVSVSQSLIVDTGSIKQQNGGELLLGAQSGVTHLNTDLVLPNDRCLKTGTATVTNALEVGSGLIRRTRGASITLAAFAGGTTVVASHLSIPDRTVTTGTVTVTGGRIGRPMGAQFMLGHGASCSSTLTSHLELINSELKAKNIFATGFFSHNVLKTEHVDVSAIDGAVATLSAFNYLGFCKDSRPTNFGMNAEEVGKMLPFLVSPRYDAIDYTNMIPLLGAAVKEQHQNRLRVGKAALCHGTCTVDVVDTFGVEFACLLRMRGALVVTQNETGWSLVRGRVRVQDATTAPTILIESANSASADTVGYCVILSPPP